MLRLPVLQLRLADIQRLSCNINRPRGDYKRYLYFSLIRGTPLDLCAGSRIGAAAYRAADLGGETREC